MKTQVSRETCVRAQPVRAEPECGPGLPDTQSRTPLLEAPWQRSEDVQEGNPAASGRNQGRCSCLPAGGQLEGGVSERGQTAAGAGRRITMPPGTRFQHRISGGMFLVQGTWMISGFQKLFREAVVSSPETRFFRNQVHLHGAP